MLKIILSILLVSINVVPQALCSTSLSSSKISVVEIQKVLSSSIALQHLKATINNLTETLQQNSENRKKELLRQEHELNILKSQIDPQRFGKMIQDFDEKVTIAQREEQDQKLRLEQSYLEAISKINETILKIVADIAFEQNFDLVLPRSQILYAADSIDITNETLTRLNAKLPSISLKF